jgi:hypothetical protein
MARNWRLAITVLEAKDRIRQEDFRLARSRWRGNHLYPNVRQQLTYQPVGAAIIVHPGLKYESCDIAPVLANNHEICVKVSLPPGPRPNLI